MKKDKTVSIFDLMIEVRTQKQKAKVLRKKLKDQKLHWETVIKQVVREQAAEMIEAHKKGYYKGDTDKDIIYAKAMGDVLSPKSIKKMAARVKVLCLTQRHDESIRLKAGDLKPVYK